MCEGQRPIVGHDGSTYLKCFPIVVIIHVLCVEFVKIYKMYYNTKSYKYISTKHTILNVYKDTNKMRFRIQKKKEEAKLKYTFRILIITSILQHIEYL